MVSGMDPGPSSLLALLGTMVNRIPVLLLLLLKGSGRWPPLLGVVKPCIPLLGVARS